MTNPRFHELFARHPQNPIIVTADLPYQANTVFNAAAALVAGETLLLIRIEDRRGISHLTVARSKDGISGWRIDHQPTFPPDADHYPEELWGVEDPRITWMEELGEFYFTYTAYSQDGPLVSLARTKDFKTFARLGGVLLPENKDAALFPRRINGRYAMLHRHVLHSGAHIWIAFSPDLKHWGDHQIVMRARSGGWWDANKIGLSPQPIYTPEGWLVLYHGVRVTGGGVIYRLGLALLDAEDPRRLLRRSEEWIFGPMEGYERQGDVDNVVFPCGWIQQGDELRLYYGGADTCIALATASLRELLDYLRHCPEK
ncbi:MAG TPA: glycosidase [bacterium]|nr:glycosidase [bacterium]